jgi:formate hydrogenlyase transcriptional activator
MAILGVGNKKTDYNDSDVNTVRHFGNLAWETVVRKRAEEDLKTALIKLDQLRINLEQEKEYLQEEINLTYNFGEILGKSKKLKQELMKIEQVATSDSTVLILGETGTGKELFARAIHHLSTRKQSPLVKVNCATLPATLIENELYGHEKGAFTGAESSKIGKFELADKGTIFLDEIGDLPLDLQAKLLRVLQENEIERIGGTGPIKIDVRVLAATNRDLDKMRAEGKFRDDLFYRLNIFPIKCPALRERKDDIPMLVKHFLDRFNIKTGKKISTVSQNTYKNLNDHNWPGNVRELENVIERAVLLSSGDDLDLGNWFIRAIESSANESLQTLDAMQKKYIIRVLKQTGGRIEGQNGASGILGLKPSTMRSRMEKLGIKVGKNIHELA